MYAYSLEYAYSMHIIICIQYAYSMHNMHIITLVRSSIYNTLVIIIILTPRVVIIIIILYYSSYYDYSMHSNE